MTSHSSNADGDATARVDERAVTGPLELNLRDDGLRAEFVAQHGENLRHVPGVGFLHYDGLDWHLVPRDANTVGIMMESTGACFAKRAAAALKAGNRALAKAWDRGAVEFSSVKVQHLHMQSAAKDKRIAVDLDALDKDPDLAGCMGGVVVDTRTGIARPATREDMLTRRFAVRYDANAACPRWESFLLEVLGGETDLVEYLQRFLGFCATGHTRDHHFLIFNGPAGRNGKGTILRVLAALFGAHHAAAEFSTFAKQPRTGGNAARDDLLALAGPRLVTISEPPFGQAFDDALMRKLTGEDLLTARGIYGKPITFRSRAKFIIATNDLPDCSGASMGFRSRPMIIPFDVQFLDEQQDRALIGKLLAELPGIFAWIIRGAIAWHRDGLMPPETVLKANESYLKSHDPLAGFLAECCIVDPARRVNSKALREAYVSWCGRNSVPVLSPVDVGRRLGGRQIRASGQFHRGVDLLATR